MLLEIKTRVSRGMEIFLRRPDISVLAQPIFCQGIKELVQLVPHSDEFFEIFFHNPYATSTTCDMNRSFICKFAVIQYLANEISLLDAFFCDVRTLYMWTVYTKGSIKSYSNQILQNKNLSASKCRSFLRLCFEYKRVNQQTKKIGCIMRHRQHTVVYGCYYIH